MTAARKSRFKEKIICVTEPKATVLREDADPVGAEHEGRGVGHGVVVDQLRPIRRLLRPVPVHLPHTHHISQCTQSTTVQRQRQCQDGRQTHRMRHEKHNNPLSTQTRGQNRTAASDLEAIHNINSNSSVRSTNGRTHERTRGSGRVPFSNTGNNAKIPPRTHLERQRGVSHLRGQVLARGHAKVCVTRRRRGGKRHQSTREENRQRSHGTETALEGTSVRNASERWLPTKVKAVSSSRL